MASLEIRAAVRGDLAQWAKRQDKACASAVASSIRRRTNSLKGAIRKQVSGAMRGDRLALAVRGEVTTAAGRDITRRGDAIDCRGRIWSKAIKKRGPGGLVDLITVFDKGAVIRAGDGKWLCIPMRIVGKNAKPSWYEGALFFKHMKGAPTAGLFFKKRPTVRAFMLLKIARIPKVLKTAAAYTRAASGLDALVAREIERRVARAAGAFF